MALTSFIAFGTVEQVHAAPADEREQTVQTTLAHQSELTKVQNEVTKLDHDISENVVQSKQLQEDIDENTAKIAKNETKLKAAEEKYAGRKEQVESGMRSLQLNSEATPIASLIDGISSGKGIGDTVQMVFNVNRLMTAQQDQMKKLKSEKKSIKKKKAILAETKETLDENKVELASVNAELTTKKKDLGVKVKALEEQIKKDQALLDSQTAQAVEVLNAGSLTGLDLKATEAFAYQSAGALDKAQNSGLNGEKVANISGMSTEQKQAKLVGEAMKYLGIPYVWGGHTPSGFDCSGFTSWVYQHALGYSMTAYTGVQETLGKEVPLSALQPGDLLLFGTRGSTHHVAMYIGGGYYVHAPKTGDVIKISSLTWYTPDFARRLI